MNDSRTYMKPAFTSEQAKVCRAVKVALSRVRNTSQRFALNGPVTALAWAMRRAGERVSGKALFDIIQANPTVEGVKARTEAFKGVAI